jgi:hypothetical protein
MPGSTIERFRAALAGRRHPGALVRACRELTHRPHLAQAMSRIVWEQAAAAAANG